MYVAGRARDAIHAAVMLNHDVEWIASFDGGFDRVPRIRRLAVQALCTLCTLCRPGLTRLRDRCTLPKVYSCSLLCSG